MARLRLCKREHDDSLSAIDACGGGRPMMDQSIPWLDQANLDVDQFSVDLLDLGHTAPGSVSFAATLKSLADGQESACLAKARRPGY